jgi:hypothetical protein
MTTPKELKQIVERMLRLSFNDEEELMGKSTPMLQSFYNVNREMAAEIRQFLRDPPADRVWAIPNMRAILAIVNHNLSLLEAELEQRK